MSNNSNRSNYEAKHQPHLLQSIRAGPLPLRKEKPSLYLSSFPLLSIFLKFVMPSVPVYDFMDGRNPFQHLLSSVFDNPDQTVIPGLVIDDPNVRPWRKFLHLCRCQYVPHSLSFLFPPPSAGRAVCVIGASSTRNSQSNIYH